MKVICQLLLEYFSYLEAKFYLLLRTKETKLAEEILKDLNKNFPNSVRVSKLNGLLCESLKLWDQALKIYEGIQEAEAIFVKKRHICIKEAHDDYNGAMKLLIEYLEFFSSDIEAWHELCEIALHLNKFPHFSCFRTDLACFAAEECILLDPFNHLNFIYYGNVNLKVIFSYFYKKSLQTPQIVPRSIFQKL